MRNAVNRAVVAKKRVLVAIGFLMLAVGFINAQNSLSHRLAVWGQIGACTRLEGIGKLGDSGYNISGCGALGIGYQLTYGKLLFTTGLEFLSMNYTQSGQTPPEPAWTNPYHLGYLQIPAMIGMELPSWYWQLGGKVSYAVMQLGDNKVVPFRGGPAGEIGMTFDRWSRPNTHYKLAVFAESGLFDKRTSWTTWLKADFSIGIKFTTAFSFSR